jgi:uncharacterized protein YodC (DUF2158 family)
MNFKVADTVRLKSGGPLMTVIEVSGDQVRCQWFDDKHRPVSQLFKAAAVEADDGVPHI